MFATPTATTVANIHKQTRKCKTTIYKKDTDDWDDGGRER